MPEFTSSKSKEDVFVEIQVKGDGGSFFSDRQNKVIKKNKENLRDSQVSNPEYFKQKSIYF